MIAMMMEVTMTSNADDCFYFLALALVMVICDKDWERANGKLAWRHACTVRGREGAHGKAAWRGR